MKEKMNVKENEKVVPGQILATGEKFIPSSMCIRIDDNIISTVVGNVTIKDNVIKVISNNNNYAPEIGDKIIGKVISMNNYGWKVNIGKSIVELDLRDASTSFIEAGKMDKFLTVGDLVYAEITRKHRDNFKISTKNKPFRKLVPGKIINIKRNSIPRIIGKSGSMINMIKEESNSNVVVGQNCQVYVHNDDIEQIFKVQEAVKLIESDAKSSGLTEKIKEMLSK
tara:strand:+ start:1729 stop:2403 length:675 start_codon:yes stop_codon:yes gene_type:complete